MSYRTAPPGATRQHEKFLRRLMTADAAALAERKDPVEIERRAKQAKSQTGVPSRKGRPGRAV